MRSALGERLSVWSSIAATIAGLITGIVGFIVPIIFNQGIGLHPPGQPGHGKQAGPSISLTVVFLAVLGILSVAGALVVSTFLRHRATKRLAAAVRRIDPELDGIARRLHLATHPDDVDRIYRRPA